MSAGYLEYHEPSIVGLLTLASFFVVLCLAEWSLDQLCGAGLIGQFLVGILYGVPIGNILLLEWQETFVALGYLGLVLIIFEGGLTVNLDLMRQNFFLSLIAAAVGIITPIGLSFLSMHLWFGHGALETFIVGAAMSTTSVGTTFVVLKSAPADADLSVARVGVVLLSAALLDDICGLIMVSVIQNLAGLSTDGAGIGWIIGRPIVASFCIGLIPPLLAMFVAGPMYRRYLEAHLRRAGASGFMLVAVTILCAFITIASYIGASVLFGAFMAGLFLSALPTARSDSQRQTEGHADQLDFCGSFYRYASSAQKYILTPLFFSSIGFSVPFKRLWTGEAVWKGIVFSVLMMLGKLVVGICVPLSSYTSTLYAKSRSEAHGARRVVRTTWAPAMFLGSAMVARGEIGLLIIQIGLNQTPFLSEPAFITAVWAILLNTIAGPLAVGILVRRRGARMVQDPCWGVKMEETPGNALSTLPAASQPAAHPSTPMSRPEV